MVSTTEVRPAGARTGPEPHRREPDLEDRMFPSVPLLQQIGLAILLTVTVGWAASQARIVRRHRFGTPHGNRAGRGTGYGAGDGIGAGPLLRAVPRQTGPAGPPSERVELSAAEREAFAGLVRQLDGNERH
ncbi:hypothetical protein [Streptomyces sp. NPDC018045]|uniref:hypothetical protein n=1 Tax=Streptomyces sp. NPDC018045 TaxID=3365037 RepID=UPI0037A26498